MEGGYVNTDSEKEPAKQDITVNRRAKEQILVYLKHNGLTQFSSHLHYSLTCPYLSSKTEP